MYASVMDDMDMDSDGNGMGNMTDNNGGHAMSDTSNNNNNHDMKQMTNSNDVHTTESSSITQSAPQHHGRRRRRNVTPMPGMGDPDDDAAPHSEMVMRKDGLAIIAYGQSAATTADPQTKPRSCNASEPCIVFNCPSKAEYATDSIRCVGFEEAHVAVDDDTDRFGVRVDDDEIDEHFLNFGFSIARYKGSSINNHRFIGPSSPIYQGDPGSITTCPESCEHGCACTHILSVKFGSVVQLVFSNILSDQQTVAAHHPVHLHGHGFAIMHVGNAPPNSSANSPDLRCADEICTRIGWTSGKPRWNERPPIKDTVIVPAHGYVVVRFRADNPGFWMMHCHQDQHKSDGMAMILQVGETLRMVDITV